VTVVLANLKKITKSNYHLPIGHLDFSNNVFSFIKQLHFLHVSVFFLNQSQPLQISRRDSTISSGDLGDPLTKSQGLESSLKGIPNYINNANDNGGGYTKK
jgi:hypothetical protein